MPPGAQVIDALWYCLCPSASLLQASSNSVWKKALLWGVGATYQRLTRRSFHDCITIGGLNAIARNNLPKRPTLPRADCHDQSQIRWLEIQAQGAEQPWGDEYEEPAPSPRRGANPWRKVIRRTLRAAKFKAPFDRANSSDAEAVSVPVPSTLEHKSKVDFKTLSKDQLEHSLQMALEGADYKTIHGLVKALIEGHGEQPSTKLYTYLLNANANPKFGSAQEVRDLLDNMTKDGCQPNSAAYHAALQVRTARSQ